MHAPRAAHPSWGMVVLLGAMQAFGAISIDMYLPGMPAIGRDLSADPAAIQRTLSALLAGLAIGQLVYGPLSDRVGRRPPLIAGVALYVVASVACALAQSAELLTAARFVQGLGACSALVVSRAFVRDSYDHQETARIFSLLMLVFGVVPILAPSVGGLVLGFSDWRGIFWLLAGFGIVIWLAVFAKLPESRSAATAELAQSETVLRTYAELLKERRLLGYILAGAFNGAALFSYIAASPELIIGTYGVDPQHFGWIFGGNAVGMIVGSQVNRRLLLRYSTDQVLSVATLFALGWSLFMLLLAATGTGGMWGVLVPLFLALSTYGFMGANSSAAALSVDPRRAGSITGLTGVASFTVGALATASVGFVHDGTAVPMAASMAAAFAVSTAALFLLALRGREPLR